MRVLLILGSAKLAATFVLIGWTVLAGAPVGSAELPGWFHLSLLVAFAGAGSA